MESSACPGIKWDDVAGLEAAKAALKESVLLPIKFPQLFTGTRRHAIGFLLFGAPGAGKSHLARAVATAAAADKATFFFASSSDFVSRWLTDGEQKLRDLFESARAHKPSVVLLDDIDTFCATCTNGEYETGRRIKSELLHQMQVCKQSEGVFVLGTTNIPWLLDPAVRRRFEKQIHIPLPEECARSDMFRVLVGELCKDLTDDDFIQLGRESAGYSGSDISVVVRDALLEPVRQVQRATHFKRVRGRRPNNGELWDDMLTPCSPSDEGAVEMSWMDIPGEKLLEGIVSMRDMQRALNNTRPSVSEDDLRRLKEYLDEVGLEG